MRSLFAITAVVFALLLSFNAACEAEVSYGVYDTLLKKYVSDETVDYISWKRNDFELFEEYIQALNEASLVSLSQDEQKAFWINAYNALTIYAVLKGLPDNNFFAKLFSVQMISGFFDKKDYRVAGESLTLNEIENKKLRTKFSDSRVHFAIVCASRSCPKIVNFAFRAKNLDKVLSRLTAEFLQDENKNRLDKQSNTLHLSQIFKWYATDFAQRPSSVISYVSEYLEPSDREYLSDNPVEVKYLFYDWRVNIKR